MWPGEILGLNIRDFSRENEEFLPENAVPGGRCVQNRTNTSCDIT